MNERRVPVLIVGAGLAGLSTAAFLGRHGVPALVVERHPGTSNQPKARGQSPGTMEALKVLGLDGAMVAASPSMKLTIVVAESLTGRVDREIVVDAQPDFSALSPAGGAMASQELAEPLLAGRARELGSEILFDTTLESFTQDGSGVTAVIRAGGTALTVRADYLVAADGHRGGIRSTLGIGTHGRGELGRAASIVFEADLAAALPTGSVVLYHFQTPDAPGATLVSTDTPGRYALTVRAGTDGDLPDESEALALVRAAAGIPDLAAGIVSVARTGTALLIADRFVAGRVLLAGDAAHTMPPNGGQGGNLAVLAGFQLAWRLALVLAGTAGPALLDGHDTEGRPYAEVLAEQQYAAMVARVRPAARGADVAEPMAPATVLFGYRAPAGALVPEPGDGALFEDPHHPSGRPGTRAPHVLIRHDGRTLSTRDLFGRGFALLTASDAWVQAAVTTRRDRAVPLAVHQLTDGAWLAPYGVTADGAVLVRPDGVIGWRTKGSGSDKELAAAFRTILGVSE